MKSREKSSKSDKSDDFSFERADNLINQIMNLIEKNDDQWAWGYVFKKMARAAMKKTKKPNSIRKKIARSVEEGLR